MTAPALPSTTPETRTVRGTCHHDCPDTCGWVATVDDTGPQPVLLKLRGNPEHPFSAGELCPKVNRFVDRVHDADRLLHPLIRTGPKGAGEFRPATWDEALEFTVQNINAAVERRGGQTIFPWVSAGTQGMIQQSSMDRALFAKLGSSRQVDSVCGVAAGVGMAATYGAGGLGADPLALVGAEVIILWATNTKLTNRHLWPFIEEARSNGARIVCIDPMRTMTAAEADWFIQPLPGTDIALMLAMMHELIANDQVDHDYVRSHADGYEELAAHVEDWTPERASGICGVSADDIRRLAEMYGAAKPAFIRTLIGAEHHENGSAFYRTIACLPVLTGSWRHPSGGVARSCGAWSDSLVDFDAYAAAHLVDGAPRRALSQNHLGRYLTGMDNDGRRLDIPVDVLVVWNGNPLVSIPNADLIRQGLEREDLFTMVSEQFMTDTARYADVIFPAATQVEQIDVVPSWGHLWLGWNDAAIAPRGESVPNTELWRRLAAAFGFDDPEFARTDLELIRLGLHRLDDQEFAALRETGLHRVVDAGPLVPYAEGGFATPNGKAQLAVPADAPAVKSGLSPVPNWIAPSEAPTERLPLMLVSAKVHTRFMNSTYSGHAAHADREGGPWVELDPADAAARGLSAGDDATIWNDRGRLRLPVRISERLRPGVAMIPWGWWSDRHEDGQTVNVLTNDTLGDMGVGVGYNDTVVEVERSDPIADCR